MSCKNYFLVFILFLTACASNQWKPSEVDEIFVTDIKPGGLKIFNYSLTKTMPQANGGGKRGGGRGAGMHGGGRGGKGGGHGDMGGRKPDNESSMKQYFNDMLKLKLEKSGYCREGYIELDSYSGRGRLQVRGECEEGATEEDRIKFVNNKST